MLGGVGLHVDGQNVRAGVAEALHIPHGAVDHQVDVQRQVSDGAQRRHRGEAEGEVGHEHTVHHVHVDVVGTHRGEGADVALQIDHVGRENRGTNLDHKKTSG